MFNQQYERFVTKVKNLHGDPHYIALGMGFGVFIAVTPTIPFHTALVLILAFVFRASKPAAVLGVWVSNPFTVVFLYVACYKTGFLFFEETTGGFEAIKILLEELEGTSKYLEKIGYFNDFLVTQLKVFVVMNIGGLVLGIPSGIAAYFLTRRFFIQRNLRKLKKRKGI